MSDFETLAKVLPQSARVDKRGNLEIGGCSTHDLARDFGTPLFVLDELTFRDRLRRYATAYGADNVHYAAKAFLTRTIAPVVASEGVGMDCASGGELYTALAGGFPADRIVLHGNNKSRAELEQAVDAGVGLIVVDSAEEVIVLDAVAGSRGESARILIRVTPGIEAHTHEYLKTGVEDTKFGVAVGPAALEDVRMAAAATNIELVGLHSHIGSQIFDLEPFAEAARVMVRFLAEARAETGLELPVLDLGGGLGISYEPSDAPPPIEDLGKLVLEAVRSEADAVGTPAPTVKAEPGRSVAGPSMITLYTSGAQKDIPGIRRYVSVDGGMSDNIRPMLYQAKYTFLSATSPSQPHRLPYAVAGKLCESGDVLTKDARLPEVTPGDLIAVAATGAYGYAMASNYNKQPKPAIVMVRDRKAQLLARRETFEDLVRLEVPQ